MPRNPDNTFTPDNWDGMFGVRGSSGKPRAKSRHLEDKLHREVAKYLSAVIARPGIASRHFVMWWSNELRGKRSVYEGVSNKQRGVIAGVPDITIVYGGLLHMIELKAVGGVVSDEQKRFGNQFCVAGGRWMVCWSLDQVIAAIEKWQIPTAAT